MQVFPDLTNEKLISFVFAADSNAFLVGGAAQLPLQLGPFIAFKQARNLQEAGVAVQEERQKERRGGKEVAGIALSLRRGRQSLEQKAAHLATGQQGIHFLQESAGKHVAFIKNKGNLIAVDAGGPHYTAQIIVEIL